MHAYRDQYAQLFKDGQNVVLIAISTDAVDTLAAWAHDDQFQFLMVSDADQAVGRMYGAMASRPGIDNRNLFVVGPDGKIAYTATPFHEIDPTAYTQLGEAINKLNPADQPGGK
jgi:peroxiredoxin